MKNMLLVLWRARSRLYGRRFFQVTLVVVTSIKRKTEKRKKKVTSIKLLFYTKMIFQALHFWRIFLVFLICD